MEESLAKTKNASNPQYQFVVC